MANIRNRKQGQEAPDRIVELKDGEDTTVNSTNREDDDTVKFSLFDIVRMAAGFIVLNVLISAFTTGTLDYRISSLPATSPLRSPIKYLKYHYMHEPILFSEKELSVYNGTDTELPLYVAVNGTVFDVSDSGRVYGPGGSYAFFGGKECAFALATNCLNYKGGVVAQGVTLELEPEETRRLKGWREFFEKKYFAVGRVVPEEAEGVENRAWRIQDRGECFGKGYA